MASKAILAIQIVSDATKAAREMDKVGASATKMSRVSSTAGKALAAGFLVAGAAAVKLGQKASDLAETQSKVNVIFGEKGAAALDKFASSAAKNLGQSKQQALDAAASFGTFGKAAGLQGTKLAGFSSELTALASDMASFSNTDPQQAIEALASGLRGEAEPLRKFGVLLDDATLRAEALKLGLIKTTKDALTPQQKVLAAQSAILKQTKAAQGDFARTSEGLANKQRILKATMEDLGTKIGKVVLPALLAATTAGLAVVAWIEKNQTTAAVLVAVLVSLVAVVAAINVVTKLYTATMAAWATVTKVVAVAQRVLNAAMRANPIGLIVTAVLLLIGGFVLLYKKSDKFRAIVQAVGKAGKAAIGWIVDIVSKLVGWVKDKLPGAFNTAKNLIVGYLKLVTLPLRTIIDVVKRIIEFIKEKAPKAFEAFKTTAVNVGNAILTPFKFLYDKIQDIIDLIKKIPSPGDILGGIGGAAGNLVGAINPFGRAVTTSGITAAPVVNVSLPGGFVGSESELARVLSPAIATELARITVRTRR